MINRPLYLNKLVKTIDSDLVKILVGVRRSGKSTLLKMIKQYLLNRDVLEEQIIDINFELIENDYLKSKDEFIAYVRGNLVLNKKSYLFVDEVQELDHWARIINSLKVSENIDIYLTGSNTTLISGDLATFLAGRYIKFEIQPFTFSEFIQIFTNKDLTNEELFEKFIKVGGMPFLKHFDLEETPSYKYLNDVYNTVLIKDVLQYNNIRNVDIFNRILSFVFENIGHNFSANSIKKYFKNESRKISVDTILNYLEYCNQAFIIKKVPRYDTLGKKILKIDEKYYLTDHGFRQARGFSNTKDIERTLENIVYIELLSRGFDVKIGKVKDKEIDFMVDGPFAVDNLVSFESVRQKNIQSTVAGDCDILVFPNLDGGNIFYKTCMFLANGKSAGIILGAKVPIVLTSRADTAESKLNSIILSVVNADGLSDSSN